jgi:hypothetical protein
VLLHNVPSRRRTENVAWPRTVCSRLLNLVVIWEAVAFASVIKTEIGSPPSIPLVILSQSISFPSFRPLLLTYWNQQKDQ